MASSFNNSDVTHPGDNSKKMKKDCTDNVITLKEPTLTKNPLLQYLVIKQLFAHLKLQEIKKLRLVCREWNSVAVELLRKRSKIVFKNTKEDIRKFWNTFQAYHSKYPFTHFEFKQEFFLKQAKIFFKQFGACIKYLKFNNVNIKFESSDGTVTQHPMYESSLLVSKCINLSELHIDCFQTGTKQFIHIRHLVSVQNLKLLNCCVLLEKGLKISPVKIGLQNVGFLLRTETLEEVVLLNDVFNFQKTERVFIYQFGRNHFILDVGQGVAQIEEMDLKAVEIINWETSQWSINNLTPARISIRDKTSLKIKNLSIHNLSIQSRFPEAEIIDISMLPATLESLYLSTGFNTNFVCSQSVDLPNLKHLTISLFSEMGIFPISHLTNCPELVSITIKGSDFQNGIHLEEKMVPQSSNKVDIGNETKNNETGLTAIILYGQIDNRSLFPVDKLVFRIHPSSTLVICANVLQKIKPNILLLVFRGKYYSWDEIVRFVNQNADLKTIFVNYSVPAHLFGETSKPIQKKPEFSVFSKQICRPITRVEFERVMYN